MPVNVAVDLEEGLSLPVTVEELERAVAFTVSAESVLDAEISLTVVGDQEISRINFQYLSHAGPTDVISFPLATPGGPLVGDIYIGGEQAMRQAAEVGERTDIELLRLAIHGTLHVLGHEHPEAEDRSGSPMYVRQEDLLAGFLATR